MLDSIVVGFEQGHSPETLQQQYPTLGLEEVYGAITYYLAHTDEVHTYLKRQDELWETWRAKSATRSSPVIERLRALRASEGSRHSSVAGRKLVSSPVVFRLALDDLHTFHELGRLTRSS
jgi:hypothetical protein